MAVENAKVLIIVNNWGIEETELTRPLRDLKAAGAAVTLAAATLDSCETVSHDRYEGETLTPDALLSDVNAGDYDLLVVPGGTCNVDRIRVNEDAIAIAQEFAHEGKPIAAICHGAWLLVNAGLIAGKTAAPCRYIRADIENAGGHYVDEQLHIDDANGWRLITSRKPASPPTSTTSSTPSKRPWPDSSDSGRAAAKSDGPSFQPASPRGQASDSLSRSGDETQICEIVESRATLKPLGRPIPVNQIRIFAAKPLQLAFRFVERGPQQRIAIRREHHLIAGRDGHSADGVRHVGEPVEHEVAERPSFVRELRLQPQERQYHRARRVLRRRIGSRCAERAGYRDVGRAVLHLSQRKHRERAQITEQHIDILGRRRLHAIDHDLAVPEQPRLMPPGAVYHCVDLQTFHWLIREHPNSGLMRAVAGLETFVNRPLHLSHRCIRRHATDDAEHQILRHDAATDAARFCLSPHPRRPRSHP